MVISTRKFQISHQEFVQGIFDVLHQLQTAFFDFSFLGGNLGEESGALINATNATF